MSAFIGHALHKLIPPRYVTRYGKGDPNLPARHCCICGSPASSEYAARRKQRSTLVVVSVPILNTRARLPHRSYFLPRTAMNMLHALRVLVTALKTSSLDKGEKMVTSWGSRLSNAVEMKTIPNRPRPVLARNLHYQAACNLN